MGCQAPDCRNDTYILNPITKTWSKGPELIEPRAQATASLLSDGTVLVAGGWSADSVGNALRSRSCERLSANSDRFERAATLAVPIADHRAINTNESAASPLLVIESESGSVQSYDAGRNEWKVVGEFESGLDSILGPFADNQTIYLWVGSDSINEWRRISLRVSSSNAPAKPIPFDLKTGLILHRDNIGFLAPGPGQNALLVGGSVSSNGLPSAAVDSVSIDGHVQPLAPLNYARSGAQVFRLNDGAIVVAGGLIDTARKGQNNAYLAPLEWLAMPDAQSRWQPLQVAHKQGTGYEQLRNGNIVAIHPSGDTEQLIFSTDTQDSTKSRTFPTVISEEYMRDSPLRRRSDENQALQARDLADGRFIVTGGYVQTRRIAVLRKSDSYAGNGDAIPTVDDEFVGIGDFELSDTYEIYDAKTHGLSKSSAAHSAGGSMVILSDGRVVKISKREIGNKSRMSASDDLPVKYFIEISRPDGTAWSELRCKEPPAIDLSRAELLIVADELFLIGEDASSTIYDHAKSVQWFDMGTECFSTILRSPGPILGQQTRVSILALPNKKTLMLPVREN